MIYLTPSKELAQMSIPIAILRALKVSGRHMTIYLEQLETLNAFGSVIETKYTVSLEISRSTGERIAYYHLAGQFFSVDNKAYLFKDASEALKNCDLAIKELYRLPTETKVSTISKTYNVEHEYE